MVVAAVFTADVTEQPIADMQYCHTAQLDDRVSLESAILQEAKHVVRQLYPSWCYCSFSYSCYSDQANLFSDVDRAIIAPYLAAAGRAITHVVVFASEEHSKVAVGFVVEA